MGLGRKRRREIKRETRETRRQLRKADRTSWKDRYERPFGEITGDLHQIHEDEKEANKAGLLGLLKRGARLAAIAQRAGETIYFLKHPEEERDIPQTQETKFIEFVYQQKKLSLKPKLRWIYGGTENKEHEPVIKMIAHQGKISAVESVLRLHKTIPDYKEPSESLVTPIGARIDITKRAVTRYQSLFQQPAETEKVPYDLLQSYAPGILIRILEEAYKEESQKPLPLNRRMITTFYRRADLGMIETKTSMIGEREKAGIYDFHVVAVQQGKILSATTLRSVSAQLIRKDLLERVRQLPDFPETPQILI